MEQILNYPALKSIVNNHKFINGARLEFGNYIYSVFNMEHTHEDEKAGYDPVFWRSGSSLGDFDIYLPEKIFDSRVTIKLRRPLLFHELAETYLWTKTKGQDAILRSHNLAREYENKYISEVLNLDQQKQILDLRKVLQRSLKQ